MPTADSILLGGAVPGRSLGLLSPHNSVPTWAPAGLHTLSPVTQTQARRILAAGVLVNGLQLLPAAPTTSELHRKAGLP